MNSITFPNFNLEFNISPIAFTVFERPIYWYGIIILSGILLSLFLANRKIKSFSKEDLKVKGFNWDTIIDLVIVMIPVGVICARFYYCIFNWEYYFNNPLDIVKIWNRRTSYIWWNYRWYSFRMDFLQN